MALCYRMPLYLGFDSSTQSLTATVIEVEGARRRVVFEHSLAFDEALPQYGTSHGVLPSEDPRVAAAPPLMWADALDRMAALLRKNVDVRQVRAISGSAQQHGSVYLSGTAADALRALDPHEPLAPQIAHIFSRSRSPIWLDCSTTDECAAITEAVGGAGELARLTGSRAYERFTAAQIRKFARADPEGYRATERIHLVSSFLASLLTGTHAPLDPGDASGMNLMDLQSRQWIPRAVDATAPGLLPRLPPIVDSWSVAGTVAPFWRERYGFPAAKVIVWSGDNPCSLVGVGAIRQGDLTISLGTSDTVFGPTDCAAARAADEGHVFGSPAGGCMALTCFANGSLARERVRDAYGLDWAAFSSLLGETPPGNGGAMMLPWFAPEITPHVPLPGVRRRALDDSDARANVRAVVEAQALAMRLHSRWIAPDVRSVRATGGAAANRAILQVIADVFGAQVGRIQPSNAASLGAALRAFHGDVTSEGKALPWEQVVAGFTDPDPASIVTPRPEATAVYERLLPQYAAFEADALEGHEVRRT